MNDPASEAIVIINKEDDTPAPAPASDADAHITVITKTHSLPKLNICLSLLVPAIIINEGICGDRKIVTS
jgi:hypothetical protein